MAEPTIISRLYLPVIIGDKYIVEAQFKALEPNVRVAGGNIRFCYDALDFTNVVKFKNFATGYAASPPNPPVVGVGNAASKVILGFRGPLTYVNAAINLVDRNAQPIYLPTDGTWQTLFEIELTSKPGRGNLPPIVLDLESDTSRGSFLPGSDGWTLAALVGADPIAKYVKEKVEQFNWSYSGTGLTYPFGKPA